MQVIVNDKKIEKNYPEQENIDKLIQLLQRDFGSYSEVVTDIYLDGDLIEEKIQDEYLKKSPSEFKVLKVNIVNRFELAFEAAQGLPPFLEALIDHIQETCSLITREHDISGAITEMIDQLDLFTALQSQINYTLKANPDFQDSAIWKDCQQLENNLLHILNDVYKTQQCQDKVRLVDLLKYELIDNLESWKALAIPAIIGLKK